MKKILKTISVLTAVLTLALALFCVNASALSAAINGSAQVTNGGTSVYTVAVASAPSNATSMAVSVNCSNGIELVSGEWVLKNAKLQDFSMSTKKGVANPVENGSIFKITVKGTSISSSANISVTFTFNDSSKNQVGTVTASKNVKVICSSHSWGPVTRVEASCTTNGYTKSTCTVCGTVLTQAIAATGHNLTNTSVTQEASCLEPGSETGTCTVCGQTVTQAIEAKGHDWGSWIVTTASTCTQAGVETKTCKRCGAAETQESALADHVFSNAETVREATLSVPGLERGTCTVCGLEVEQETACKAVDYNGIAISTEEGVFQVGTELSIVLEKPVYDEEGKLSETQSAAVAKVQQSLSNVSDKFVVVQIDALLNGAVVQPNGTVELTIPMPSGFSEKTVLFYINSDGSIETVASKISADGTKLIANFTHFSEYAITDLKQAVEEKEEETSLFSGPMFIAAAAELIIIIALALLYVMKKAPASGKSGGSKSSKKSAASQKAKSSKKAHSSKNAAAAEDSEKSAEDADALQPEQTESDADTAASEENGKTEQNHEAAKPEPATKEEKPAAEPAKKKDIFDADSEAPAKKRQNIPSNVKGNALSYLKAKILVEDAYDGKHPEV